jgi:hypothetical protein
VTYSIDSGGLPYEQSSKIIVSQATRDKFFYGQFLIVIAVHFQKDLVHFDTRRIRAWLFFAEKIVYSLEEEYWEQSNLLKKKSFSKKKWFTFITIRISFWSMNPSRLISIKKNTHRRQ